MFLLEFVTIQFFRQPVSAEMIQGIRRFHGEKVKAPINRLLMPTKKDSSRQTSMKCLNPFMRPSGDSNEICIHVSVELQILSTCVKNDNIVLSKLKSTTLLQVKKVNTLYNQLLPLR